MKRRKEDRSRERRRVGRKIGVGKGEEEEGRQE